MPTHFLKLKKIELRLLIATFTLILTSFSFIYAQQDSIWRLAPKLSLHGFADVYYGYDFNQPALKRHDFLFNHNRHNQFAVNNVLLQFELEHTKYRAKVGLHTGTYAMDNYASEPPLYQFIYQANVGLSLSKKNRLWLDVGVLPSHMGFETALSIENPTLTRSLVSENSPYYLTGAKVTFSPNEKWELAGIVCNGWQQIQRSPNTSIPAGGTQLIYKPTNKLLFNWSTFIHSDFPDSTRRMRYFNNLYAHYQATSKFLFILGFDIGIEQKEKASTDYHTWFSPVVIGKYMFTEKWALAARAEYYQDRNHVIIPILDASGFSTFSASLNVDYSPIPQIACRIEGRMFLDEHAIYPIAGDFTRTNFFVSASVAIQWGRTWK